MPHSHQGRHDAGLNREVSMSETRITCGISSLDELIQGLRLGDNVIWQMDHWEAYRHFTGPFVKESIRAERKCIYLRFASHPPILDPQPGLEIMDIDPQAGFDAFSVQVHQIIEDQGRGAFYVFDSLSSLVVEWATDELLANFFQITCPFLYEMDTVAYFHLLRGRHAHSAVARIRDTTQVLIDVYQTKENLYIHPLKVLGRYSPQMYLPHLLSGEAWIPVYQSGAAADLSVRAHRKPLFGTARSTAPWEAVYHRLMQYLEIGTTSPEALSEIGELKQELSRMILGAHPEFNRLADTYLSLDMLLNIRDRMIGSGRIGGKAAGMLLARSILEKSSGEINFLQVCEAHDSFYVGSDVFFTFLVHNDLFKARMHYSRNLQISPGEFEELEIKFLAGKFPPEIMAQFQDMLDHFGQAPIIVRSSSLLEDSFGNAFAGKYRSEFCANQGTPEDRMKAFLQAIKLVYASALNPDALAYRWNRGLGERDEQMAILIQRVSGMNYRKYFFPSIAGVAFSHNLYAWSDRIDPEKGMIRMVFGLGTRAVNRVGNDYPRMIAVSHPNLRPEASSRIAKYSQWEMDLLDLEENRFDTRSIREVVAGDSYPHLGMMVSLLADGYLYDPFKEILDQPDHPLVLTFNNLIRRTDFIKIMDAMLTILEEAYGHPVDTEFTASLDQQGKVHVNLLQCRPMRVPGVMSPVEIPEGIPGEEILFKSHRSICGGIVPGIRYLLYIDPRRYAEVETLDRKKTLGRVVGKINQKKEVIEGNIILMGPGRWGSSNIDLGVNVTYGDISNAAALVEIAWGEAGHHPEVSFGTHFFLDLVEAQIIYLPIYPSDPSLLFNEDFLLGSENALATLLPEAEGYGNVLKLIDIPFSTGGKYARIMADPEKQIAICYLERPETPGEDQQAPGETEQYT